MATARDERNPPPPSEQLHLPEPSYLPVIVAFGTTVALAGVVLAWALFAIGMAIVVLAVARWVRDAREEMSELPLDHRRSQQP